MPEIDGVVSALRATEPTKIRDLLSEKLIEYEQFLAEQIPQFGHDAKHEGLRQECQHRIFELRSERQHRELRDADRQSLTWERVGIAVGIVFGLIGTAGTIYNIFFSKVPPATSVPASPLTYRQTPAPTAALSEQAASSNTSTPSPEQAATAQPTVNPTESSNNSND